MNHSKLIHIACPARKRVVQGKCITDKKGDIPTGPDGAIDLREVCCNQDSGKCTETLCAMHRFNRMGPSTWFPDRILIAPEHVKTTGKTIQKNQTNNLSTFSTQA